MPPVAFDYRPKMAVHPVLTEFSYGLDKYDTMLFGARVDSSVTNRLTPLSPEGEVEEAVFSKSFGPPHRALSLWLMDLAGHPLGLAFINLVERMLPSDNLYTTHRMPDYAKTEVISTAVDDSGTEAAWFAAVEPRYARTDHVDAFIQSLTSPQP